MLRRRDVLTLGATVGLGVALRGSKADAPARPPARRLLVVFCAGGWDTTWSLEPKPAANADLPPGAVRKFGDIDIFVDASRPRVTDLFERYAGELAIVRGIATDGVNHPECQRRIATGTREATRPDLGAIIAHDLANDLPAPYLVLGTVAFTGPYAASAARVGGANQIVDLLDASPAPRSFAPTDAIVTNPAQRDAEAALLRDYALASAARERAARGQRGYNRRRIDDFVASLDRAEALRGLRDRFGRSGVALDLLGQIPLALDALETGLSQAVILDSRQQWDTHTDNYLQGAMHDETFGAVRILMDELHRRPGVATGTKMIDDTVVLVVSEMSRGLRQHGAPGHEGKDHWTNTAALLAGAGVRTGKVFGATTDDATGLPIDLATGAPSPQGLVPLYANFVAGMLKLCGVDPDAYLQGIPVFDAFVG